MSTLLSILHLFDSALPIGSYAHSSGLETYTSKGLINDEEGTKQFISQYLREQFTFNDGLAFHLAYAHSKALDVKALIELDQELSASCSAIELLNANTKLSNRVFRLLNEWKIDLSKLNPYLKSIKCGDALGHYPITLAIACEKMKIERPEAYLAFLFNTANSMIVNAVKLIPLGQMQGQRILAALKPKLQLLADQIESVDSDQLGRCAAAYEMRCMQHETLYSRQYMS